MGFGLKMSILAIFLILSIISCIDPFSPPEVSSPQSYLVMDGFLNIGTDTTVIELRRTQNINEFTAPVIESGAMLTVESEEGVAYFFSEIGSGKYVLPPGNLDPSGKYRLRIETASGQEYLSEFVSVSLTPPIDDITYRVDPGQNAMVFYVNTHDPQGKTQFYRWKFEETWAYRSTYYSGLEVVNGELVTRNEDISLCWSTSKSRNIILGNTIKLTSDIIKDLPVNTVRVPTNKLLVKYSILVKQYGLSREAFEYWTTLLKTTQTTGSLFDAQPSLVTGNIRSTTDREDLVFGYFSASKEEEKRIVITPYLGSFERCTDPDTLPIKCPPNSIDCALLTPNLILTYWGDRSDSVLVANPGCTDCRLKGGTNVKPSFM